MTAHLDMAKIYLLDYIPNGSMHDTCVIRSSFLNTLILASILLIGTLQSRASAKIAKAIKLWEPI